MSILPDGRYIDDAPYDPDEEALQLDNPELDAPPGCWSGDGLKSTSLA